MALTALQRRVCRLIAANRKAGGESYVAGGVALNELLAGERISRDIDLFRDSEEALAATWKADRPLLEAAGLELEVVRERPGFVEARVRGDGDSVLLEWARNSAFRFFPLVEHAELGLTLHPFDLATNKVLALVGRLEVRDWIDLIQCHERLQPLGYLIWAACGKDPGFGPLGLLEEAGRTSRYSADEINALIFSGPPPDAAALSRKWHGALAQAREILAALPLESTGHAVLTANGALFGGPRAALLEALAAEQVRFHRGALRGVFPQLG